MTYTRRIYISVVLRCAYSKTTMFNVYHIASFSFTSLGRDYLMINIKTENFHCCVFRCVGYLLSLGFAFKYSAK